MRKMDERKQRRAVILFGSLLILLAAGMVFFLFRFLWGGEEDNRLWWRLETPFVYDEAAKKAVMDAQAEDLCCMFWKKNRNVIVENPEFSRKESMNVYGAAGNTAALFSGANVLWPGEEGHCLLSADAARKLFGSTDVVGKHVRIGENDYKIAGIQHNRQNLCVYELSPKEGQKVNFAACWYQNKNEKYMVKKRVMTLFSFS